MRKYLAFYETEWPANIAELTAVKNKPFVGVCGEEVKFTVIPAKEEEPEIDLTVPYVTFTAEEDGSSIGLTNLSSKQTLEYSTDTTTWDIFDTATNIPLNNRDKVYVRGVLRANNTTSSNYTQFKMSGKVAASGNCNAIWNYEDLNAPLKEGCGCYMFRNCTSLTTAPELPATTLATKCYYNMFYGCTALTQAPVLPAETLSNRCYVNMFSHCTSLTTAPELPATTLAISCYQSMFEDCASLTTAPALPAETLSNSCYVGMFWGCTGLTQAPELPATTLTTQCYMHMFWGCTGLTQAPELPATTLTTQCYMSMFYGCYNLNYIKCLAINKSASGCTGTWVNSVASTGTFIKHPDMTSWTTGTSGIPSGWTVIDAVL